MPTPIQYQRPGFFSSVPAQTHQLSTQSPAQQNLQQQSINRVLGLLGQLPGRPIPLRLPQLPPAQPLPNLSRFNFEPIAQQARERFQTQTVPTIAERFTAMFGPSGQNSSAFSGTLGQAGRGLERDLAAMQQQYNFPLAQLALQSSQFGATQDLNRANFMRQNALQSRLPQLEQLQTRQNLFNSLLGPSFASPFMYQHIPYQPSGLQSLLSSVAGALPSAALAYFTGTSNFGGGAPQAQPQQQSSYLGGGNGMQPGSFGSYFPSYQTQFGGF